jgi:hypothetical protein
MNQDNFLEESHSSPLDQIDETPEPNMEDLYWESAAAYANSRLPMDPPDYFQGDHQAFQ